MRTLVVWIGVVLTAGLSHAVPQAFNLPLEDGSTVVSMNENVTPGTSVLQVNLQPSYTVTSISAVGLPGSVDKTADFIRSVNVIETAVQLDFETINAYVITIIATRTPGTQTSTTQFTLQVLDMVESPLALDTANTYTAALDEGISVSTVVFNLNVIDPDVNDNFTCTLSGSHAQYFFTTVVNKVCVVKTQPGNPLDYEAGTTTLNDLHVLVTDTGGYTDRATLTVNLNDVNDNVPSCQTMPYSITEDENAAPGTTIVTLTCTDADDGVFGQIDTYTIVDGDDIPNKFVMSGASVVTTSEPMDYETKTGYVLKVEVTDNGPAGNKLTGTTTVLVSVVPVNEHTAIFTPTSYTATVVEGSPSGTSVETVTAADADQGLAQGTVTYKIANGNVGGAFTIDSVTGEVTVSGVSPDRELWPTYRLEILAYDSFPAPGNTATTTMTVTITDINDNIPQCSPSFYQASITEPSGAGASILAMTATDDDEVSSLTYSVNGGDPYAYFSFSSDSLILNKEVDYETYQNYSLEITVSDGPHNSTCTVTVTILATNEFPPEILAASQTKTLPENIAVGTTVYDVNATDLDHGLGGTSITFTIISGNTNNDFYCDPDSGAVSVFNALDYDTLPNTYNMTIQSMDDAGNTDVMWLEVILTDVNDQTPTFTKNVYMVNIREDVAVGTTVETVSAKDTDTGLAGNVTYTAVGGNGYLLFVVDPDTGDVYTNVSLDREDRTRYTLDIEAVDNGSPPLSSTTLVDIWISDYNDNPPKFLPEDYFEHLLETSVVGTSVSTVTATDPDSGPDNNRFLYSLANTYFEVNAISGEVSLKAGLDRETQAEHVLKVKAADNGIPVRTGTATITVLILDVNDNPPVVTGTYANVPVLENATVNTIVDQLIATDADDGENANLTYTIIGGNTDSDFKINSVTGVIQVANALDRERTASYGVEINIRDNGSPPYFTSATVTINVGDVNDNDPVWVGSPYTFNIGENLASGQSVGTVAATDADAGSNSDLTYVVDLFWAGDLSHFSLDQSTGVISTTTSLDREQTAEYHARLIVRDGGVSQRSALVNVSIAVNDLNDNAPVFDKLLYSVNIPENDPIGTGVLIVTVTDPDTGVNDDITLSIDTSNAAGIRANNVFQVLSSNGVVSIKQQIDRETDGSFGFTLVATDGGAPSQMSTASVTVQVTDVNDNPPVFSPTYYNTEIAYTGVCKNSIVTVTATDADLGDNAQITYFPGTTGYSGTFQVDGSSGLVTLISGLSVNSMHHLNVSARDGGIPSLTSTVPALVRVDAMYPNDVVVTFKLGISVPTFTAQLSTFLSQLQSRMRTQHSYAVARFWCAEVNSDGLTDAHVYFLKSAITDDVLNKDKDKMYITEAEARALFTSDADGAPNSAMQESQWAPFLIQWIRPYYEKQRPWYETDEGICILAVCGLLGLCLLALACFMCLRYCRVLGKRPKKPRKFNRPISVEERRPPSMTFPKLHGPPKAPPRAVL